ncbi:Laccase-1 [Apostasia shenzhenica]|uniref:Laccase n=1 Tax=Apostasia shenzhenica TaxID=1088818 RepID=A0A2I0AU90_9ASPA|nr:Laccase-1 [Apostasia shenzhenica]
MERDVGRWLSVLLLLIIFLSSQNVGIVHSSSLPSFKRPMRFFHFEVEQKNVTRLCHTRSLLTINGQYPGPSIVIHEGDHVVVKVTNKVEEGTTIHWHGVRQYRTGWADGTAYLTQCPIRPNTSYTYRFTVEGQRGTLFWHAHHKWQRATVHGAFIILPASPYPFKSPPIHAEIPIIFGDWWNADPDSVEAEALRSGGGPNVSDAFTINGFTGPLYPSCSSHFTQDTFIQTVEPGKTYMLRLINAALNDELFFAIAGHQLTVVEADAVYTKPFTTTAVTLSPGQTTAVLLTAGHPSSAFFPMAIRPYVSATIPFANSSALGFLRYTLPGAAVAGDGGANLPLTLPPNLPPITDAQFANEFSGEFRSLASDHFPCLVPKKVDRRIFLVIGINLQDCCENCTCLGFKGKRVASSINNQSFLLPQVSLLQSFYSRSAGSIGGDLSLDFPDRPAHPFNYTGTSFGADNMNAEYGGRLLKLEFGERVELVFQDMSLVVAENHPMHLHGNNFFVVGSGIGNYDRRRDSRAYNLEDPPERNTVAVPRGGWAAIRFTANNPGVWYLHCHLEIHATWGLAVGIAVENGPEVEQKILPPPADLPLC